MKSTLSLLCLALLLSLAACGGDAGDDPTTDPADACPTLGPYIPGHCPQTTGSGS